MTLQAFMGSQRKLCNKIIASNLGDRGKEIPKVVIFNATDFGDF
jgi:hypothetical protein